MSRPAGRVSQGREANAGRGNRDRAADRGAVRWRQAGGWLARLCGCGEALAAACSAGAGWHRGAAARRLRRCRGRGRRGGRRGRRGRAGGLLVAAAYVSGDRMALSALAARPVSEVEQPELYRLVRELSKAGRLPVPRLYLSPAEQPNSFTVGRCPAHRRDLLHRGLLACPGRDRAARACSATSWRTCPAGTSWPSTMSALAWPPSSLSRPAWPGCPPGLAPARRPRRPDAWAADRVRCLLDA